MAISYWLFCIHVHNVKRRKTNIAFNSAHRKIKKGYILPFSMKIVLPLHKRVV